MTIDKSEVRTVSSTGAHKGQKLARFDLIPADPLWALAEHYGKGAEKYTDHNWRKGLEWSKNYQAALRHFVAWWAGEDIDEETGSSHLIALAWHAFALEEYRKTHPELDNRPTSPYFEEITARLEEEKKARQPEVKEPEPEKKGFVKYGEVTSIEKKQQERRDRFHIGDLTYKSSGNWESKQDLPL